MTFSIAAFDRHRGEFGIAVSSAVPAVGAAVPFVSLRGAIATQSRFNFRLGATGIQLLELKLQARQALRVLLDEDPAPELRQVHGLDVTGSTFAHTGSEVKPWRGHLEQPTHTIAGNTLVGEGVISAMDQAFRSASEELELSERLLRALIAGQEAGGDRRGRQSAALLLASPQPAFHHNLRVDEHTDPVPELWRVFEVARERGAERATHPRHVPLGIKW